MTSTSVKVIWADFGSIFTRLTRNLLIFNPCAQDETRTHTILRPLPPQSSVYTNFTTCARAFFVPRTGLEPAHLAACAPETHASTNSAIWAKKKSGKRDSNSRPRPWQGRALPTELFPQSFYYKSKINAFNFRKRVQRYCFFLTYANFSAFFLHFFAFSVILFCACARPFLLIFII